jgi:hypothetical protein
MEIHKVFSRNVFFIGEIGFLEQGFKNGGQISSKLGAIKKL